MSIIQQAKEDLAKLTLGELGTEAVKVDGTTINVIFRETSNSADIFDDEISGQEIFIIGKKEDLANIEIENIITIDTRTFKVISKEESDFKVKLKLEEL